MCNVVFSVLMLMTCSAHADSFYKLVGYECNKANDELVITYDAAANSAGEAMHNSKSSNQWDPWDLVTMKEDENHLGSYYLVAPRTIVRKCRLSDGLYTVRLGPQPGNFNMEGRCGVWMSAWAEVKRGKKSIYAQSDFEIDVGCMYDQGEIITRISIRPKQGTPKLTKQPAVELLSGT